MYPVADVQTSIYVVSRADTSNGIGGNFSTTYGYFGAKADLSSAQGLAATGRFLGVPRP
jgi:hypothetical protein